MHKNSELLFRKYGAPYIKDGAKVLEIGPDLLPISTYQACCNRSKNQWHSIDLYVSQHLTYTATTPYEFPIADNTYDVVISGQVIEHVPKIWVWMQEIVRITKPGGFVITIAPCSWPYHEAPHDCWRIYPDGMRALVEDAGLVIDQINWGSLETPEIQHSIPGRSFDHQPQLYRELMVNLAALGDFPIEKSFDTICIARKPMSIEIMSKARA